MGCDPGKLGCVALLSSKDDSLKFVRIPLAGTAIDIKALIAALREVAPQVVAAGLEDVHALFGSSAKATFEFGRACGIIRCALEAAGVTPELIQPKEWQKRVWLASEVVKIPTKRLNKKGEFIGKTDTKATSLLAARRLFPGESFLLTKRSTVPSDGAVDAALIAWTVRSAYLKTLKSGGP